MDIAGKIAVVRGSKLFRVFYSTGATTAIKILSTIVLSKLVAVQLGPEGLALLGQLTNFVTIALLLATGGFANGIIKYVSEFAATNKVYGFIQQSFKLTLIIAALTGIFLLIFSNVLSKWCFSTTHYNYVFMLLGVSIIFYASANYFTALLNGLSDYKTFNSVNAVNSIVSLFISAGLILMMGLPGAFLAVALNQTFSCFIILFFTRKYLFYFKGFAKATIEKSWVKNLFLFSAMALVTALIVPTTQILIRRLLISTLGAGAAGEWEAINRISNLYLTLLINIMLVYYLPKLSAENNRLQLRREIRNGFIFFSPIIILMAITLFLLRYFIITTFLSPEFLPVQSFFLPQLVGDIFKILSFLFAYMVIAKRLTVYFIITEVFTNVLYCILSFYFIDHFGTIGPVYAYMLVFILYFFVQFYFIGKIYLNENFTSNSWIWKGGR